MSPSFWAVAVPASHSTEAMIVMVLIGLGVMITSFVLNYRRLPPPLLEGELMLRDGEEEGELMLREGLLILLEGVLMLGDDDLFMLGEPIERFILLLR